MLSSNIFLRINGIVLVVDILATSLSGALMLKSPWLPFLLSIPIEAACIPLLLFVPSAKHGQPAPPPEDESANKASAWSQRIPEGLQIAYRFIKDNLMVFILLLPWIPAFYARHPFILIYAAKKFDTTFADVRIM